MLLFIFCNGNGIVFKNGWKVIFMGKISVYADFETFCKNLRMSDTPVKNVQDRYHSITKRVNLDYWSSSSETTHSRYVGSYGRGTSIYTSDIDIIVELPWSEYIRYCN